MRRLFGTVARRKASIAVGTLLVLVVAGTTVASAPGTYLRMGVTNTITGNYLTTLQGTVSSFVLYIRNNSTNSASAAIRAYSPFGGVPLDLRAKAGAAPMRVNSSVKVPFLNVDLVDGYSASAAAAANTIPVRDASTNTIDANISGNAATANNATNAANAANATNATNAGNANTVGGYAANQLIRGNQGAAAVNTSAASTVPATSLLSSTAPVAGGMHVTLDITCASFNGSTNTRWNANLLVDGVSQGLIVLHFPKAAGTPNGANGSLSRFIAVGAGTHTVGWSASRSGGDGSMDCNLSATTLFLPFGNGGTTPSSVTASVREGVGVLGPGR